MTVTRYDQELDATGLDCPLPMLRTKKALSGMKPGEVLHVIATDPGAEKDFHTFARQTGHELLEARREGAVFHFVLKKRT